MSETTQGAAYADLLAAVLALRADPASERFDAELAAAEASGELDGATARTLRWWQRESVRAVGEHLAATLPDLLVSLEAAAHEAHDEVQASAASWARAAGQASGHAHEASRSDEPAAPARPAVIYPRGLEAGTEPAATGREPGAEPTMPSRVGPVGFTSPGESGAPRARLIVAGLTVLSEHVGPHGSVSSPDAR
jgi:hypothetical protein